jgi:colanic acid/amylovoran biosynthesis glycosyltransferase
VDYIRINSVEKTTRVKQIRIGIVLNKYPMNSETFINSFVGHLDNFELIIYAQQEQNITHRKTITVKPYINKLPRLYQLYQWISIIIKVPLYLPRFLKLYQKGGALKQLIADANIWTTSTLDVLHFPFANNAFRREHYAEILGTKMTLSFRGSDLNVYPIYHQKSYDQLWPYVHKVHCNSFELAAKLNEHKIPVQIPIKIIPPALRSELQDVMPLTTNTKQLGTPENPLNIVTLGRLHWVKDYPFALRIMAQLKQKGLAFHYQILGEGIEREQLMFLIHELGLKENVKLHGRVNANAITHQFKKAHLYLQTSLAEGFSNACLEAQAFCLPCVVPAISGMSACIEDGKTGFIVSDRSEAAFSDAIISVIERIHQFDYVYISNRIKKEFSLEKQKHNWLSFFEELA